MKQDKGKKMVVIDTGKVVKTTGKRLWIKDSVWIVEAAYKNGVKHWYYERELDNYIS